MSQSLILFYKHLLNNFFGQALGQLLGGQEERGTVTECKGLAMWHPMQTAQVSPLSLVLTAVCLLLPGWSGSGGSVSSDTESALPSVPEKLWLVLSLLPH